MTSIDRSFERRLAFERRVASARPWACAVAVALAGCQTPPSSSTGGADAAALAARYPTQPNCKRLARTTNTENTVIGGALGGTIGGLIGAQSKAPRGTVHGTLIGAFAGAAVGSQFNSAIGMTELPDGSVKVNVPGGVLFHSGSADINPAFQQTLVLTCPLPAVPS